MIMRRKEAGGERINAGWQQLMRRKGRFVWFDPRNVSGVKPTHYSIHMVRRGL